MITWKYENSWGDVTELDLTEEVKDKIVTKVMQLYTELGITFGEGLAQSDSTWEKAPVMIAELADELPFKRTEQDD